MKLRKIIAALLALVLIISALPAGAMLTASALTEKSTVSAADSDWADYLVAHKYTDNGSSFGNAQNGDLKWDFPNLYGDMFGIYSADRTSQADRWPYMALKVRADEAGKYTFTVKKGYNNQSTTDTLGVIVNGGMNVAEGVLSSADVTVTVYLYKGENTVIFTTPIPRDYTANLTTNTSDVIHSWLDFKSFTVSSGAAFVGAPTADEIKTSMGEYTRVEAEDSDSVYYYGTLSYVDKYYKYRADGNKISDVEVGTMRSSAAQTYDQLAAGKINYDISPTICVDVQVKTAGKYLIRVGAYIEGSGAAPFGTLLVNGKAQKIIFGADGTCYDAATLEVELEAGRNVLSLVGVTSDQNTTSTIAYDYIDLGRNVAPARGTVKATDNNWAQLLTLNKYQLDPNNKKEFGTTNRGDLGWDYPSLYEDMYGIYSPADPSKANRWCYIASNITALYSGDYTISANIAGDNNASFTSLGVIVDGALYAVDYNKGDTSVSLDLYLKEGTHTVIFTSPMPMSYADSKGYVSYPWLVYKSFSVTGGAYFDFAPDTTDIQSSMSGYTRIEAENDSYFLAGNADASTASKEYSGRYSKAKVTVISAADAAIDGTVTDAETARNSAQTLAELQSGGIDITSPYLQTTLIATKMEVYNLRVGAYLESEGAMPFGVMLVNGIAQKIDFKASADGYYVANTPVELNSGENTIQLIGATADADDKCWIGYDFIDFPKTLATPRVSISASDADKDNYFFLNKYELDNNHFALLGRGDIYWDYPNLYIPPVGIYSGTKPDRTDYWPYVAFAVNAQKAGYYTLRGHIGTDGYGEQIGLIVNGGMYVVDNTTNATSFSKSIFLNEGRNLIIATSPMPRDAKDGPTTTGTNRQYSWMNYHSFTISAGADFAAAPTKADIIAADGNFSRVQAEDELFVGQNGSFALVTEKYASRYGNANVTMMAPAGSKADNTVTNAETALNSAQSLADLTGGGLDKAKTPYLELKVIAEVEGIYAIRVGAYIEGALNAGNLLINDKLYAIPFTGEANGYDAATLAVQLKAGENTLRLMGFTSDLTTPAWIGYDFIDLSKGLTAAASGFTKINAGDESLVLIGERYKDNGDILGGGTFGDLRWDRISVESFNYGNLPRTPYGAIKVTAPEDGSYEFYFNYRYEAAATSHSSALLVDGAKTVAIPLSGTKTRFTLDLTKGSHTIVFTSPMPLDTAAAEASGYMDSKAYPWMDMVSFVVDPDLKVEKAPKRAEVEAPFTRAEVEKTAIPNLTRITTKGTGYAQTTYSQTAADILKNGINPAVMPFIQFTVKAEAAGSYTLYLRNTYAPSGKIDDRVHAKVVAEANGKYTVAPYTVFADTKTVTNTLPITLELKAGLNTVRVTHLTADSNGKEGYVWNDYDYIDAPAGLTVMPTITIEAEKADYSNYAETNGGGYSADAYLGYADYSYVYLRDITFEKLDIKKLGDISRVTFNFTAPEAGTYDLSMAFGYGMSGYTPQTVGEVGFTVIVNGNSKELIKFRPGSASGKIGRTFSVDLEKGENTVTVLATLADYMAAVSPRIESEYKLFWFNMDAMYLSYGLTEGDDVITSKQQHSDTGATSPQLKLEPLDKNDDSAADKNSAKPSALPFILIGVAALAVIATVIIILVLKKKKKK